MIHSKNQKIIFVIAALFILLVVSCRKKDERFEGTYIGVERYMHLDSGETQYDIDSTYLQEVILTYDKAFLPKNKYYLLEELNGQKNIYSISHKSIVDGLLENSLGGGYVKFYDDSIYIYKALWSDTEVIYDLHSWEFKGKRN